MSAPILFAKRQHMKKKALSKKTIFFVLILFCAAIGLGFWALIHYLKTHPASGVEPELSGTTVVDLNNPTAGEYGKIYCAPIDVKHIATEDSLRFIDNEVLIVVKDGVSESQVRELAAKYNSEIVGMIEVSGDYQLRLAEVATKGTLESIMQRMETEDIIDSVSFNYVADISVTEETVEHDGYYYGKNWQSDLQDYNDVIGKSWGIEAIKTMGAWDELTKHKDQVKPVRIGLIDDGFDFHHDDLGFAEVFYDNGVNGVTSTSTDHGTHVAGIMAAKNDDTTGICGVYPYGDKNLYGVALYGNKDGAQGYSENGDVTRSVMWMKVACSELIVRNVKVINTSWGFNWYNYDSFTKFKIGDLKIIDYALLKDAWETPTNFVNERKSAKELGDFLERMLKKGYDFVIVTAAGNDSDPSIGHLDATKSDFFCLISKEDCPNAYDRIIVVGAVTYTLEMAPYTNGGDRVDIYAPGGDHSDLQNMIDLVRPITDHLSSWTPVLPGGVSMTAPDKSYSMAIYSTKSDNLYGYFNGTSQAAPHVAGVAAMVWSANNSLDGAQVKEIIRSSWNPIYSSCHVVDAEQAVRAAFTSVGNRDTEDPENGIVTGYVVERFHEENRIEKARVALKNTETGEIIYLKNEEGEPFIPETDSQGHFEITAPKGTYTLSVSADGYEPYEWPDADNYQTPIIVENGQVNYLDWVKLWRSNTKLTVYAYDKKTTDPITNREITITITNPKLTCDTTKQYLSDGSGSATFYVATGKMKGYIEADITLHIDGYKDYVFESYPFDEKTATGQKLSVLFERPDPSPDPVGYYNDEGYVVFGHYEQDGDLANGKEPIEWIVLEENETGKLLMSRYILDCVPFNKDYTDVMWDASSLRSWLNNDFAGEAFSEEERALILLSRIAYDNIETDQRGETEDQVFCLSLDELTKYYKFTYDPYSYFGYCKDLIALPTTYAKDRGVRTYTVAADDNFEYAPKGYTASCAGKTGAAWWLRTAGWQETACAVLAYGYAGASYEFSVSRESFGVRPTLWVDNAAIKDDPDRRSENKSISFGRYAGEDIEWIILEKNDESVLLISKYVIEGRMFNDATQNVTWETSALRRWLNGEFYSKAFSKDEKDNIYTTTVKTPPNPNNGVDGGKDTEDRVFLLSIDEVYKYFPAEAERTATATDHAANSVYLIRDTYGTISSWWLRSMSYPGTDNVSYATHVSYDGTIGESCVDEWTIGIRPVIRVSREAIPD